MITADFTSGINAMLPHHQHHTFVAQYEMPTLKIWDLAPILPQRFQDRWVAMIEHTERNADWLRNLLSHDLTAAQFFTTFEEIVVGAVQDGVPASELRDIVDLFTRKSLDRLLVRYAGQSSDNRLCRNGSVAATLVFVARHWLAWPEREVRTLRATISEHFDVG